MGCNSTSLALSSWKTCLQSYHGELNSSNFCFVFWEKKKAKRLYLPLIGRMAGSQRPGILPFKANSSPVTRDYQCFLQVVVCNCVTVRDEECLSPCPGWWCQVFPHWRGNPAGCDWWTPWKSCWSSNIQKLHSTRNPSTDRELCQQHQRSVSKQSVLTKVQCTRMLHNIHFFLGFYHPAWAHVGFYHLTAEQYTHCIFVPDESKRAQMCAGNAGSSRMHSLIQGLIEPQIMCRAACD